MEELFEVLACFTFHNVSINTIIEQSLDIDFDYFTFHNVSINTKQDGCDNRCDMTLHSTMFLLIRVSDSSPFHSPSFTFHNVSINTRSRTQTHLSRLNFTFHNVSINTKASRRKSNLHASLHSTMFLLIPQNFKLAGSKSSFTFHNVSINTDFHQSLVNSIASFTFHNVSINTLHRMQVVQLSLSLHSTMFLLIRVFV